MTRVRCLLFDAILNEQYRVEADAYSVYTLNRCAHTSLDYLTPKWSKHPPNLDNQRVFGCVSYFHQNQGKLKPRAVKCMFVGFTDGMKDFKM